MLCMAFSVGTVSLEAKHRDVAINEATEKALIKGLWSGCYELTNPTRVQVQAVISELESADGNVGVPSYGDPYWSRLRRLAQPIDCEAYSKNRSTYYAGPSP